MEDTTENDRGAILVGIADHSSDLHECEISISELEQLLDTAGGFAFAKIIQVKEKYDPRTCIGSGKVKEIKELCAANDISLVVFDIELSPSQIRNLEEDLGNIASVIDRSMLILDIFALHAKSGEGKLQVELAQLRYSAPRIMGKGLELSRQGGGIGTRGPGESKLETDRRHMRERIRMLERRLLEMEHNRMVMRAQRDRSNMPKVALVGYTNTGKSTLLNALTDAGVLAEDKLFATLDPTTRKMTLPCGEPILLTDTVGFIRKLPHHLVEAFKSTLDEVRYADILIIVSDINDPETSEHLLVTEAVIEELGASGKPVIYVYNKSDLIELGSSVDVRENSVLVSAKSGAGIDDFLLMLEDVIHQSKRKCRLLIPYTDQAVVNALHTGYTVVDLEYSDEGVLLTATLDAEGVGRYRKYIKES